MKKIYTLSFLCIFARSGLWAQCNPDVQAPTLATTSLSVNIMPTKMIVLWDSDFIINAQDNCTAQNALKFAIRRVGSGGVGFPVDSNGIITHSVTFNCNDIGTQMVEAWVRDAAGNANYGIASVAIGDNGSQCGGPPKQTICAVTEALKPLEDVNWELSTLGSLNLPTMVSGPCLENLPFPASAWLVTPNKINDPLNGVSTFDLVLINKHILGLEPLSSPYKILAADANNSRSITTFDIVELRKLILGIYTVLPHVDSWRFLPISFSFPNPSNPFQTVIPGTDTLNSLNFMYGHVFFAVKTGDVNGNAVANSIVSQPDNRSTTALSVDDRLLRPGETARIALRLPEATALLGMQFAVQFNPDALEITGVEFGESLGVNQQEPDAAEFYAQPEPGLLNFSWDDLSAPAIAAGEPLLYLNFKALQPVQLSRALAFQTGRLQPELYAGDGVNRNLALEFSPAPVGTETEIFAALPNPSAGAVNIPISLAGSASVRVVVYDLTGREIYFSEQALPAGFQRLEIPAAALANQSGVLAYRVQAGEAFAQGKMLRQ